MKDKNHLYEDDSGVIHSCDSTRIGRFDLVWTKCSKDVPANKSFKSWESPTCKNCTTQSKAQEGK